MITVDWYWSNYEIVTRVRLIKQIFYNKPFVNIFLHNMITSKFFGRITSSLFSRIPSIWKYSKTKMFLEDEKQLRKAIIAPSVNQLVEFNESISDLVATNLVFIFVKDSALSNSVWLSLILKQNQYNNHWSDYEKILEYFKKLFDKNSTLWYKRTTVVRLCFNNYFHC